MIVLGKKEVNSTYRAYAEGGGVKVFKLSVVALLSLSIITAVYAEEAQDDRKWGTKAEFSFVDTGGNTEVTTLSLRNTLKYKFNEETFGTWGLGALYGKSDGVRNAERYFTEFRLDHLYTERLYSFANAGWYKDKFKGIDARYYMGSGAGYKFITGPKHFLTGEAGLTYTVEDYTDGTDKNYLGGRLFGLYEYLFNANNKFFQSLELLEDFDDTDDWLLNSETGVISALNGYLSLRMSYVINYDNVPVEGSEHTDTVLGVTLVARY